MNITDVREILKKYKSEMSVSIFDYWIDNRMFRDDTYNSFVEFSDYEQISKEDFNNELNFIKHLVGRALVGNTFNIENSFRIMKERNWEFFYCYIDVHKTILFPAYDGFPEIYYPMSKETLQKLSNDKRIKLVLYTCSYKEDIEKYLTMFKNDNINFDFVNKIDVPNNRYGDFSQKSYKNCLIDDVAGFEAIYDWFIVNKCIENFSREV